MLDWSKQALEILEGIFRKLNKLLLWCIRHEARTSFWTSESWGDSNSGKWACGSAQWGSGEGHLRKESLHFRRLQLCTRGGGAPIVSRSERAGSRGHAGERASGKGRGARTQHAWDGGSGGAGLLCAKAGSLPLQSEVQTQLAAEGRGRERSVGA